MTEKISGRQTTYLALGVLLAAVFLPIAQNVARTSGRDGWMVILPGYFATFPFVYLTLYTYLKAPGKDLLQQAKILLGPWLGYPLIIAFLSTTAWFGGLLLRQGGELFATNLMVDTPLWVFITGELIIILLMVYCGLEVFARFNEVVVIPILASLVVLIIFSIPKAELGYLKPYLDNGFKPLLKGVLTVTPFGFKYVLFLWILLPLINKPHEVVRSSLKGYLIISLILTGLTMTTFCVLSPEETVRLLYSPLSLARMAEAGKLFHGLEAFFITFWLGGSLITVAALFFCSFRSLQAIIPIKHNLLNITLFSLVLLLAAYVPRDNGQLLVMIDAANEYLMRTLGSAGTTLLAAAAYARDRWGK